MTGLSPDELRHSAGSATTQGAALDFLCAHEPDLLAAAQALALSPAEFPAARERLAR